jgi:putative SOS response-associated peptidase YedK
MCGRFTLIRLSDFTDLFPWILPPETQPPARYNIAPSQPVAAVANSPVPKVDFFRFGLIPSWARDPSIGDRLVNARAETAAEKPAFKAALRRRRCLIPASGFYEWRRNADGTKTPMYIRMKSGRPFAFAGLWDTWQDPGGSEVQSCTIITTGPNEVIKGIHDRMPVILAENRYKEWLAPEERRAEEMVGLLKPYPAGEMMATAVSRAVNNPKNDSAECIEGVSEARPARGRVEREEGGLFPPGAGV